MSMYEELGGESLVGEAVATFYAKLQSDPVIAGYFEQSNLDGLEMHQRMFLTAALGGPDAYEGRDMRAAHAHLPITDTDFDQFVGHLGEVLAAPDPLRHEIVSAAKEGSGEFGGRDPVGGSG